MYCYQLLHRVAKLLIIFFLSSTVQAQTSSGRNIPFQANPIELNLDIVKATEKATAAVTDSIQLNSTQSQTDHNLTGTNVNQGISNGRSWVNSDKGYFSFELMPDSVISNEIKCTYWGGDAGLSAFDIYVENVKISTQRLKATLPGSYISVTYAIPLALTRHKQKVTIKFQSKTDSISGPLYACLIQTSAAASYYWPLNIHDPSSIIKCGDTYYVYGTGDGIFTSSSKDLVKWKTEPTPFAKWGFPGYITTYAPKFEGTFWAPECIYMNGKYYLYYAASEWGTKNSCIGVATNVTLNPSDPAYNWVDQGLVVSSGPGSNYNAIDPSVMRDPKTGKIWLTYGSFNLYGIQVTELDSVSGKAKNLNIQYQVCNHYQGGGYIGEAAFMIHHNGFYFLFVNFGGCCAGVNSSYYIVTGRGNSPTGPFYDKTGANLFKIGSAGGGTIVMKHDDTRGYDDRFYGPGCLGYYVENGSEYVNFHYYDPNFPYPGQPAGGPMMAVAQLKWDSNDWPVISMDWLDKGRYTLKSNSSNYFWEKSSAMVVQNAGNSNLTQQWDFYPLGTGEYKIGNASVADNYIETSGTDRNGNLVVNAFANAIYEKFRILKSVNNEYWFYQSAGMRVFEVPFNSKLTGVQIGVNYFNSNKEYEKWTPTFISELPTNTNKLEAVRGIEIYPNPVQNKLKLTNVDGEIIVEVYDITGKLIISKTGKENKEIDFTGVSKGLYTLRIIGKGITQTKKIRKE